MKKKIICVGFLTIIQFAGNAQRNEKISLPVEKHIPVASFDQLTIAGNFNLTLSESDEPGIQIKGNPKFLRTFKVSQRQKTLSIKGPYDDDISNEVIVNVKNLKKLTVQTQSVINSKGILQSKNLNILLYSECYLKILNNGNIKIKTTDNFDLEYSKEIWSADGNH